MCIIILNDTENEKLSVQENDLINKLNIYERMYVIKFKKYVFFF